MPIKSAMGLSCLVLALSLTLGLAHRPPYNTASVRREGMINLHLVPHTHDDVGWLKNIDEYYTGSHEYIQKASVLDILTSVVQSLSWNADAKMTYVEMAFFERFWNDIDNRTAAVVQQLVASGQLEFIGGGYCMHDEATPSAMDMIDQMTLGHRLLSSWFNVRPKAAWQIDPFGHSAFQASVLSGPSAGFSSVFFMRADWQEVQQRNLAATTEMVWAPSPTLGLSGATYAGILYGGYCTVQGLSRDYWTDDEPVRDSPYLEDNNVAAIVNATVATVLAALEVVPQGGDSSGTQDIMLPLGCDFEWYNAAAWHTNTGKLIHYLNLDGRINALYSTPSIYAAAKLSGTKAYTLKTADFLPYDIFHRAYLVGFYTSRPALKHYIRATSALLQAAKQLQAFTGGAADLGRSNPLYLLERAMAEAQHHDAITGTSRQPVAYDYARRLARGREGAQVLLAAALTRLSTPRGTPPPSTPSAWQPCDLANVTLCAPLELLQATALNAYNSASAPRTLQLRIPVPLAPPLVQSYAVLAGDGASPLPAQLLPLSPADVYLREHVHGYFAGGGPGQPPLPPAAVCTRNFAGNYSSAAAGQEEGGGGLYAVAWVSSPTADPAAGATFTVLNLSPPASGSAWRSANGTLSGPTLRNFTLVFDSSSGAPAASSGVLDAACAAFQFADGLGGSSSAPATQWRRVGPQLPPPQVAWLAFQLPAVPAMGFSTVFLVPSASPSGTGAARLTADSVVVQHVAAAAAPGGGSAAAPPLNLTNGLVTLTFDPATGALQHYSAAPGSPNGTGLSLPFSHSLFYYAASAATATPSGPPSGAYIMRPNASLPPLGIAAPGEAPPTLTLLRGPVCSEARLQHASGWAALTLRLWEGVGGGYAAEYTLGPLPVAEGAAAGVGGKELCAAVGSPALATGGVWHTDSNHRDSMRRQYNRRPDWNLTVEEPVAGNLYPAGGFLYAVDGSSNASSSSSSSSGSLAGVGFSVLPDRAIAGGVLAEGMATLLLHRRLQLDDQLGVGEVLSEPGLDASGSGLVVSSTHQVLVHEAGEAGGAVARRAALVGQQRFPVLSYLPLGQQGSPASYAAQHLTSWSALAVQQGEGGAAAAAAAAPLLPPQVELATLHAWGPSTLLLRLAHRFEAAEPEGAPVALALAGLLNASSSSVALTGCTEMTVTGNAPLAEVEKVTYRVKGGEQVTLPEVPSPPAGPDGLGSLTLAPLAIRTFLCQADMAAGGPPIVL